MIHAHVSLRNLCYALLCVGVYERMKVDQRKFGKSSWTAAVERMERLRYSVAKETLQLQRAREICLEQRKHTLKEEVWYHTRKPNETNKHIQVPKHTRFCDDRFFFLHHSIQMQGLCSSEDAMALLDYMETQYYELQLQLYDIQAEILQCEELLLTAQLDSIRRQMTGILLELLFVYKAPKMDCLTLKRVQTLHFCTSGCFLKSCGTLMVYIYVCTISERQDEVVYYDTFESAADITEDDSAEREELRRLQVSARQLEARRGRITAKRSYLRNKRVCVCFTRLFFRSSSISWILEAIQNEKQFVCFYDPDPFQLLSMFMFCINRKSVSPTTLRSSRNGKSSKRTPHPR